MMPPNRPSFPDDEQLDVPFAPQMNDLVRRACTRLASWLDDIQHNIPLSELREKADAIMQDIQIASGLPGSEVLAVQLAVAMEGRFEQIGLGKAWYKRLIHLYNPVMMADNSLLQAGLLQCLMHYFLSSGDLSRASTVIDTLLEIAEFNPDAPLKEIMLAEASIANTIERNTNSLELAEQLMSLAEMTGDLPLMGRVYSIMSQFYVHKGDVQHSFEYAQMTLCIGQRLENRVITANGLYDMALAFYTGAEAKRAFGYLMRAIHYCRQTDQIMYLSYVWYMWAGCCYMTGNYIDAESHFRQCAETFEHDTSHYGHSLYGLGVSLMQQWRYDEAIVELEKASQVWKDLHRPFDQYYVDHAMAELYFKTKQYERAVELAQKTLANITRSEDARSQQLYATLKCDLEKYKMQIAKPASSTHISK